MPEIFRGIEGEVIALKILTSVYKTHAGYVASVNNTAGSEIKRALFTTKFDAEKAVELVEAAVSKLTGEVKSDRERYAAKLAAEITARLRR